MSTILKALKKLEQENENRRLNHAEAIHRIDIRQAVKKNIKAGRLTHLRKGLWFAIVFIFAGSFGYYFFEKYYDPDPQSFRTIISNKHDIYTVPESRTQKQALAPSKRGLKQEAAVHHQKIEPESKSNSRMKAETVPVQAQPLVAKPKSISTAASETGISNPHPINITPPSTSRAARIPGESQASKKSKVPENKRVNATSADKQILASVPRLTDGRLQIQAIAWAPAAPDRMAVINNRIVREGYAVDGFSIETIGENEVVVREGDMRWKVLFGRP